MRFIAWVNAVTKESWASWERLCEVKTSRVDDLFEDLKVALDEYAVALDEYGTVDWEDLDGPEKLAAATSAHLRARTLWKAWRREFRLNNAPSCAAPTFDQLMDFRGYNGGSQVRRDVESPEQEPPF